MVVQEASREARSTIREWTRYGGTNQILYLALGHSPRDHSLVRIRGKCNKLRRCALWPQIVGELPELTTRRSSADHVFLNRFGEPITRFGIHTTESRGSGFTPRSKDTYEERFRSCLPSPANG